MKNCLYILLLFVFGFKYHSVYSQTGINTRNPHTSSALDITSSDKGVLLPKHTLTSLTSSTTPVNNPQEGALIYNESGVHPRGYYFWDGSRWQRLIVNYEMDQIYNLRIPQTGVIIPEGTSNNYINFGNYSNLSVISTLIGASFSGQNITLPAGTYKIDISMDCSSAGSNSTGVLVSNKHLYIVDAVIEDVNGNLLTDLKTASCISNFGGTSIQRYGFSFILKLESSQTIRVNLKNGSGATSNARKDASHTGLSIMFKRVFNG